MREQPCESYFFAVTFPMVFAALAIYPRLQDRSRVGATQSAPGPEITAPSEWVAFDAEMVKTYAGKSDLIYGHLYRSSDGSERQESGKQENVANVITIKNIAQKTFYYTVGTHDGGKWYSHPMRLPRDG